MCFTGIEKVFEVEAKMIDLEQELARNSEDARSSTAQLKDTCAALERQNEELSAKMADSDVQRAALHAHLQHQQEALEHAKEDLTDGEDTAPEWQGKARRVVEVAAKASVPTFFSPSLKQREYQGWKL
jgi:chromosome segregation ATPase